MNTFTYKYNPSRDFGSNLEFHEAKPSLLRLLAITQVVMSSWEKDAYTASRRTQGEAKRKLSPTPTTAQAGSKYGPGDKSGKYKASRVTSQHILCYCTYYSVSLTCTVHTVTSHVFPVSHVEVSSSTYVLS